MTFSPHFHGLDVHVHEHAHVCILVHIMYALRVYNGRPRACTHYQTSPTRTDETDWTSSIYV